MTQPTAPVEEPKSPPRSIARRGLRTGRPRDWVVAVVILSVISAIMLAFYIWIFHAKRFTVPIGWDMSEYLWRTFLGQHVGLKDLQNPLPSIHNPKAGRPGFPVLGATLGGLTGQGIFRVSMVMSSVVAVVMGLAGGAFVGSVLKRPLWQVAATTIALTLSPFVVRLMTPEAYMDNMFASGVFLVGGIAVAAAVERRWAILPAILLIGAGGTIEGEFFLVIALVLVLCAVFFLPASWRRWRAGEVAILDTPSARFLEIAAGAALFSFLMIHGVLANNSPSPRVQPGQFAKKVRDHFHQYNFPVLVPLAAVGIIALAAAAFRWGGRRHKPVEEEESASSRPQAGFALAFLVGWGITVLGAYLAWRVLHLHVPADRFLAFSLFLPILAVVGLVWLGRLFGHRVRAAAAGVTVGVVLVLGLVVWEGVLAHGQWFSTQTWTDPGKLSQAATADSYLRKLGVPLDHPVVVIMNTHDSVYAGLMTSMARAAFADRIQHLYLYFGSPQAYLQGRPTATKLSRDHFPNVRPVLNDHPWVVAPSYFNSNPAFAAWARANPGRMLDVDGGIGVVKGTVRKVIIPPSSSLPIGPVSAARLGLLAVVCLAILGVAGLGWTILLLGPWCRPAELIAAAPAVGVAAIVVGGIMIDRLGFRLAGTVGDLTPVVVGLVGWIAAAVFLMVRRERPGPAAV